MPRKNPAPLLAPHQCDGTWIDPTSKSEMRCQEFVLSRRPSASGLHYCPSPRCQAAKQRRYRAEAKVRAMNDPDFRTELVLLVNNLIDGQRTDCHACGLTDALVGWLHRSGPGSGVPCTALGNRGAALPPGTLGHINRGGWPE